MQPPLDASLSCLQLSGAGNLVQVFGVMASTLRTDVSTSSPTCPSSTHSSKRQPTVYDEAGAKGKLRWANWSPVPGSN